MAALPWRFEAPDGLPVAGGIDIATIVDGRIHILQTMLAILPRTEPGS